MNVWLVTVGEPLPSDPGTPRLLRAGMLADYLWRRGHNVTWWTSTFDHRTKTHRFPCDETIQLRDRYRMRLLKGPGYRRNVSISRLFDHRVVARKFTAQCALDARPDVILASFPTIELSAAASAYGVEKRVPVVIDIRDLWPDLFLDLAPKSARWIVRLALLPMYREARRALSRATAIVGNATPFVEWGVRMANRSPGPDDQEFPFGYYSTQLNSKVFEDAASFWEQFGISRNGAVPVACFFGTFGRQFDIGTVIAAARLLEQEGPRIRFILCGDGERLAEYRAAAAQVRSVVFPGWVDAPKISVLMSMSTVGLAPYVSNSGFIGNLPNKPIEYLSASLPVVSGIDGYLGSLLRAEDCGVTYDPLQYDSLARQLRELISDTVRLSRLRSNAKRVFETRFSADAVYERFVDYLESVGARQR